MPSEIQNVAYEKYKLDWMIRHGHTLTDMFNACKKIFVDGTINCDIDSDAAIAAEEVRDTFEDGGFGGEIWASFPEFIEYEYIDKKYMGSLLNYKEYRDYLKEIDNDAE